MVLYVVLNFKRIEAGTLSEAQRRRGRRIALAILAVCAAPVVAAWLAYFVWPPESRGNYGELIEPRPLADPELHRADGGVFRMSALRGKWVLVHIDAGACGAYCRQKLLYMRQVRLAQGREMDRIERVWLVTDDAPIDRALLLAHEGIRVARTAGSRILAEFPAAQGRGAEDHVYVVDPLGNLMLRFPRDADPSGMRQDLSRLLRASRIG